MFFSSHVTGQSHNPAKGCRLAHKEFIIFWQKSTLIQKHQREFFFSKKHMLSIWELMIHHKPLFM